LTTAGLWTYGDWRHVATGYTVPDPIYMHYIAYVWCT